MPLTEEAVPCCSMADTAAPAIISQTVERHPRQQAALKD